MLKKITSVQLVDECILHTLIGPCGCIAAGTKPGCKHFYICSKVGHFNMGVNGDYSKSKTASSGQLRTCRVWHGLLCFTFQP